MTLVNKSLKIIKEEGSIHFFKSVVMQIKRDIRYVFEGVRDELNPKTHNHLKYLYRGLLKGTKKNLNIGNDEVQRIICSYNLAKKDQSTQSEAYPVTGDRENIVGEPHHQIIPVIDNYDTPKVKQISANFARDPSEIGRFWYL